jgi:hypothetical protein
MKLTFENLGALDRGTIELADLTIVCGENNTGKTYVTYAVYCLLKSWISMTRIALSEEMNELRAAGIVKINIKSKIIDAWPGISGKVIKNFLDAFPAMMASRGELFANARLGFEIEFSNTWIERGFSTELRSEQGRLLVSINKSPDSTFAEITAASQVEHDMLSGHGLQEFIEEALVNIVLADLMPNVFMASTERTGATIFRNDLNLAKNSVFDLLEQLHKDGSGELNPGKVFATLYRRNYARPVDDNVRFANTLPGPDSEIGVLAKAHPELLEQFSRIVGGQYVTNKEGVTNFQPSGTKLKLGLGETSSAVRSLLILLYWLKFQAKEGNLLMIDEPELNLHPSNQRRLARFLVSLVNFGVKVFITTHSDTIVREFNTLIMLSRNLPHAANIREKNGYDVNEMLDPGRVRLYYTGSDLFEVSGSKQRKRLTTLLTATIDPKMGIDVKTFDQNIMEMAAMQDELRYGGE